MEYEIHITVKTNLEAIEAFKTTCKEINVKPIVIEVSNFIAGGGEKEIQVMTSSKHNNYSPFSTATVIVDRLEEYGYKVLREKIEIKPSEKPSKHFIYYETHFRLKLPKFFDKINELKSLCSEFGFHYSRNLFKTDTEFNYQMITYRSYKPNYKEFIEVINTMKSYLDIFGVNYDKVEIEECILDSNSDIDANWLSRFPF